MSSELVNLGDKPFIVSNGVTKIYMHHESILLDLRGTDPCAWELCRGRALC